MYALRRKHAARNGNSDMFDSTVKNHAFSNTRRSFIRYEPPPTKLAQQNPTGRHSLFVIDTLGVRGHGGARREAREPRGPVRRPCASSLSASAWSPPPCLPAARTGRARSLYPSVSMSNAVSVAAFALASRVRPPLGRQRLLRGRARGGAERAHPREVPQGARHRYSSSICVRLRLIRSLA